MDGQYASRRHGGRLVAAGLPLLVLLAGLPLVVVLSGLLGFGASIEPYGTQGGAATRLDGTKATGQAVGISQAVRLGRREPVYVRGYLLAPPDDEHMLCDRLEESGDCRGAPMLVLDTSRVDLYGAKALEHGCCAIGLWSPRPVVLHVTMRGGHAVVLD